jgi:hypothetical protein
MFIYLHILQIGLCVVIYSSKVCRCGHFLSDSKQTLHTNLHTSLFAKSIGNTITVLYRGINVFMSAFS